MVSYHIKFKLEFWEEIFFYTLKLRIKLALECIIELIQTLKIAFNQYTCSVLIINMTVVQSFSNTSSSYKSKRIRLLTKLWVSANNF